MVDASGMERRINLRLLSYWEKLRKGRAMPAKEDLNPEDLPDLWDNCFVMHVSDLHKDEDNYDYAYLGESITQAYHQGRLKGKSGEMVCPEAENTAPHFFQVIESRKPLLEEGEFFNHYRELVKYRQCLLPLGQDNKVEAIFGGMSFKIF